MEKISMFCPKLSRAGIEWFHYNYTSSKLHLAIVEWYRCNIFFSKEAVFVSGLVFGHSFVEHAVVSVMITFIRYYPPKENLPKAAAIVNFQEGLTTFMALVISHISYEYNCRLNTLAITNAFYIIGLVLLWLAAWSSIPSTEICLFYPAIVLIALGKAAEEPILKAFLADQLCEQEENPDVDEKQAEARSRVWWRASWFLGATAAVFFTTNASWKHILMISAMVMGVSYLFFRDGVPIYYCKKSEGSLLTSIFRVFKAAISKRHLDYPRTASQYYKSDNKFPHNIPLYRWLDKAAIITSTTCSPEEEERKGKLCTVKQVEEVKSLLNMVPMWSTFLVYSLVEATESTFFIEQTSNLNPFIGDSFEVPIVSLIILQSFTSFIISYLFELLIPPSSTEAERKVATRVRILIGMVCSMFSCIAAYLVESHRLNLINNKRPLCHHKYMDMSIFLDLINIKGPFFDHKYIDMSIFWLFPQFFLCGVMAGLACNGLEEFLTDQLGESLGRQGERINECVLGTGKFITIFCIFLFRGWFGDTINKSHLDYYYILLAGLSFVSLLFSCVVFYFYADSRRRLRRGGSRCNLGRQSYGPKPNYVEAQGEEEDLDANLEDNVTVQDFEKKKTKNHECFNERERKSFKRECWGEEFGLI